MLPFLQGKKLSSLIIANAKPEGGLDPQGDEGENHALHAAAEDIMRAVHAKDTAHLANALQAAFDIMDRDEGSEG